MLRHVGVSPEVDSFWYSIENQQDTSAILGNHDFQNLISDVSLCLQATVVGVGLKGTTCKRPNMASGLLSFRQSSPRMAPFFTGGAFEGEGVP